MPQPIAVDGCGDTSPLPDARHVGSSAVTPTVEWTEKPKTTFEESPPQPPVQKKAEGAAVGTLAPGNETGYPKAEDAAVGTLEATRPIGTLG